MTHFVKYLILFASLAVLNQIAGLCFYPGLVIYPLMGLSVATGYILCFMAINYFWQRHLREYLSFVVFSLVRMACFGYLIYALGRLSTNQAASDLVLFGFFAYLIGLSLMFMLPRFKKAKTTPSPAKS